MDKRSLLVHGMHGMGDNIHQRAILRELMKEWVVYLDTSWACIYHDLIAQGLRVVRKPVALRTQIKNADREKDKFAPNPYPGGIQQMNTRRISYGTMNVRQAPSNTILEAMFRAAGLADQYKDADYRLPVPDAWFDHPQIKEIETRAAGKPICFYRPLVARPEWRGSMVRNANTDNYAEIFAAIRDNFFVVSIADLLPQREWIVGPRLKPDMTFHGGELVFEQLAALAVRSKLMFTSSGFGSVLAPAVGTPCISITGGYEPGVWHADGAKFAPYLYVDPIRVCWCGTSACTAPCPKTIDTGPAIERVRRFVVVNCGLSTLAEIRPVSEIFDAADPNAEYAKPMIRKPFPHHPHPLFPNRGNAALRGVKA